MTFFLYDSLSKVKKEFIPINSKDIRVYACGPTVYSYAHIGNARMSVGIYNTKHDIDYFMESINQVKTILQS